MWNTGSDIICLEDYSAALMASGIVETIRGLKPHQVTSSSLKSGIPPFDRLTREQQIAAVSEIAAALFHPDYPAPEPAAYRSATVVAVFRTIEHCIQAEVFENTTVYRGFALLAHAEMYGEIKHGVDRLCTDLRIWRPLISIVRKRILDDLHLEVADEINDLPPESADSFFREFRIERDYFIAQPPDPRIDQARTLVTGTLDLCRSVLMKKVLETTEGGEWRLARAGTGVDMKGD